MHFQGFDWLSGHGIYIFIYHKGSVSFVLSGRSNLILHTHCLLSKKAGLKQ